MLHESIGDDAKAWLQCVESKYRAFATANCSGPGTTFIGVNAVDIAPDSPGLRLEDSFPCAAMGGPVGGYFALTTNPLCDDEAELDPDTLICIADPGEVSFEVYPESSPAQPCPPNPSNPCNPIDGNKYESVVDYRSAAEGGLTFTRHYNSLGSFRTANHMGAGWRHTYSRALDEQPDQQPMVQFAAPVNVSSSYTSAAEACTSGWDEIKSTVWSGDLASATASFAGGNVCTISSGGNTAAYFPIRSAGGWGAYVAPTSIRTITRPDGRNYRFEQSGTDWVNLLDPSVKLEQSGGIWTFTDNNDTKETFDSSGRLISITERNGQSETLDYDLSAAQGGDDNSATLDRVTGPFGHTLTFAYDANGRLASVTTPDGIIQYGYDAENNLTSATYPDSTFRQYVYEDAALPNHLTGIVDENDDQYIAWEFDDAGRAILSEKAGQKESVGFAYNVDGTTTLTMGNGATRIYTYSTQQGERQLSTLTGDVCGSCPGGNIAERSYDANGFVSDTQDWNGNVTETVRNSRGLVEARVDASGTADERTTTTVWHSTFRLPTQVVTPKNTTNYAYDSAGNLTSLSVTDGSESRTWTMTYNASGQPLTIDGPRTDVSDVTTLAYYECTTGTQCGQLSSMTNALGHVTTYDSYDAAGRLLQATDPNGLKTIYTYDSRGMLTAISLDPDIGATRTTLWTYDDAGQVETLTLPDGQVLNYTYDDAHYLRTITDNLGNRIEYDYDAMGNVDSEEVYDPVSTLQRAISFAYDLNGRMETITSGGFSSSVDFDDVGNLSSMTDGNQLSTSHQYDALNRLTSSTDALSRVVSTTYDDHDNALSVSLAGGVTTSYEYDDLDNRTKEISPDRGTILYVYDEAGNVVSMTDARGKVTDYDYDALNRLVLETLDGSQTIAYSYDTGANGIGRLVTITDSSGSTTRSYNAFGEVTQKVQSIAGVALTTAYGYDAQGRLTSMTLPSGKIVSYGYSTDLPVSVTVDSTTVLTNATYEPFGPVSGWQWGNSDTLGRSYDARGLLESTTVGDDTWTYVRDGVGNVLTINDGTFDEYFEYDDIGRLFEYAQVIGLQWPPLRSEGYLYDVNGNRTRTFHDLVPYDPLPPPTNSNRVPSPLTPTSSKTNTYDAAGNTLSDGIHTYGYDDRGRLVDVDAGSVTYLHNGEGQRVKKDDGTEVLFAYDEAGATIGEYDSTGSPITEHVWFNGVPVAVISGSAIHYVYTDHLGTPRAISDSGGTVIWRWVTYPFGDTASDEDPDGNQVSFEYNLRFPGQYYDEETGLHYNYYRTYDPSTGRYLESDPIGLNGGLNTYAYVGNMPTMYVDLLGLEPTVNYFPRNEQIYHNAQKIPDPPPGVVSVAGHGNENLMVRRFSQYLDARRLADLIRSLEEFNGAKKVTLLSCNVGRGEDSLAQRLADELGIPVEGPNKFIFIDSNGDITIADPLPNSVNPDNEFDLSNALPDPNNLGEFVEYQPR